MPSRRWRTSRGPPSTDSTMRSSERASTSTGRTTRAPPSTPLGVLAKTIFLHDIDGNKYNGIPEVSNCEYVASYNLSAGVDRSLMVPGTPALWTPRATSIQLRQDSGIFYRDKNALRFPEHPLEPLARSIFHLQPQFQAAAIDLIACGSTLRHLLRFVKQQSQTFSFIVQTIGQTTSFLRRNKSPDEQIEDINGFGHNFVYANTTWAKDVRGSASHQRIIKYNLGDIKMLMRFEVDCCIIDESCGLTAEHDAQARGCATFADPSGSTSTESAQAQVNNMGSDCKDTGLAIIDVGLVVPQLALVDIKTRSCRKELLGAIDEQLARLWVRQIPNLVLSMHDRLYFEPPVVGDMAVSIQDWQANNKDIIICLIEVVREIRATTGCLPEALFEVRGEAFSDMLDIRQLSTAESIKWHAMSRDMEERWAGSKEPAK